MNSTAPHIMPDVLSRVAVTQLVGPHQFVDICCGLLYVADNCNKPRVHGYPLHCKHYVTVVLL